MSRVRFTTVDDPDFADSICDAFEKAGIKSSVSMSAETPLNPRHGTRRKFHIFIDKSDNKRALKIYDSLFLRPESPSPSSPSPSSPSPSFPSPSDGAPCCPYCKSTLVTPTPGSEFSSTAIAVAIAWGLVSAAASAVIIALCWVTVNWHVCAFAAFTIALVVSLISKKSVSYHCDSCGKNFSR